MQICLNGLQYELEGAIERSTLPEWTNAQVTTGKRLRTDKAFLSVYAKEQWDGGLGVLRQIPEMDEDRFWDSDAETRFPGQITPPILAIQDTITPAAPLHNPFYMADELYALSNPGGLTATAAYVYKFTPGSGWGSYCLIATQGPVHCAVEVVTAGISVISAYLNTKRISRYAISGVPTLQEASYTGSMGTIIFGKAIKISDTQRVFAALGDNSKVSVYYDELETKFLLKAGIGGIEILPVELVGTAAILVGVSDGVYGNVRVSQSLPYISDLGLASKLNCRGMTAWNGKVYIPLENGSVLAYLPPQVVDIGPETEDGLSEELSGPITATAKSNQNLFIGKSADIITRKAAILSWDELAWNFLWKDDVTNRCIADMIHSFLYGIERLHFFISPTPSNLGATLVYHLPYVGRNPISTPSLSVATQGYFTDSQFFGYTPETENTFLRLWIQGEGISSFNTITALYGINGATPNATLGIINSVPTFLKFGDLGTKGNYIQLKYLLTRGTLEGTYPQFKFSSLEYVKVPDNREIFNMAIDVLASSRKYGRDEETILSELKTAEQTVSLIPFWYGKVATKSVKITQISSQEQVLENQVSIEQGRKSLVRLQLAELIK